jgi:hypothetical protein
MLKIKPFDVSTKQILQYANIEIEQPTISEEEIPSDTPVSLSNIEMENWINISGDSIEYKLNCITGGTTVIDITIPFDVIKSAGNFSDQSLWTVKDSTLADIANKEGTYTVKQSDIVNVYTSSFQDRPNLFVEKNQTLSCPLKIFVPSKTSSITDLVLLTYSTAEDSGVITTVGGPAATSTNVVPFTEGTKFATQMMATISITASEPTTAAGDQISLQVEVNNPDITDVFVDPIYGSVNKTRIPLTNGIGSVLVSTDGMNSGEQVRVKFGWYSYTGVASFNRTLS